MCKAFFLLIILGGSFPLVGSFFVCVHDQVLSWIFQEDPLQISGSFSNTLSCELYLPRSPQTHSFVSLIQGVCQVTAWVLLFWAIAWKLSQGSKNNHRTHLICFLSLRDHCPLLFQIFYLVYLVSGGRINRIPIILYWLKAEVLSGYLKFPTINVLNNHGTKTIPRR